eukprot:scaffold61782_cov78-Phaeocystis_antarctica.AAC.2
MRVSSRTNHPTARGRGAAMALSKLSGDEHGIIFSQLCNVLDPRVAVALNSVSHELREPTQAQLQQLRADHETAAALCPKLGKRSCKELREARNIDPHLGDVPWVCKSLSAADMATLGTLGSVLSALKTLHLSPKVRVSHCGDGHALEVISAWASGGSCDVCQRGIAEGEGIGVCGPCNRQWWACTECRAPADRAANPYGVQRLAAGLGVGALPALIKLRLWMHVGDTGALALAAALDRGALPRVKFLELTHAAIRDAGLIGLAPALRRMPALLVLSLAGNPLGDEGLAALVAPPPPAGPPPTTTGGLTKLGELDLSFTEVTDAGCATLAAVLDSGALPALETVNMVGIPASAAAQAAAQAAVLAAFAARQAVVHAALAAEEAAQHAVFAAKQAAIQASIANLQARAARSRWAEAHRPSTPHTTAAWTSGGAAPREWTQHFSLSDGQPHCVYCVVPHAPQPDSPFCSEVCAAAFSCAASQAR